MGRIKNIKLHIVTDIKVSSNLTKKTITMLGQISRRFITTGRPQLSKWPNRKQKIGAWEQHNFQGAVASDKIMPKSHFVVGSQFGRLGSATIYSDDSSWPHQEKEGRNRNLRVKISFGDEATNTIEYVAIILFIIVM